MLKKLTSLRWVLTSDRQWTSLYLQSTLKKNSELRYVLRRSELTCDKNAATFNGMDSGAATSLPQLRPSSSVIAAKMALESSPALRFFRITVQSSFSRNPRGGEATAATARTAGTLADWDESRGAVPVPLSTSTISMEAMPVAGAPVMDAGPRWAIRTLNALLVELAILQSRAVLGPCRLRFLARKKCSYKCCLAGLDNGLDRLVDKVVGRWTLLANQCRVITSKSRYHANTKFISYYFTVYVLSTFVTSVNLTAAAGVPNYTRSIYAVEQWRALHPTPQHEQQQEQKHHATWRWLGRFWIRNR